MSYFGGAEVEAGSERKDATAPVFVGLGAGARSPNCKKAAAAQTKPRASPSAKKRQK